MRTLAFDGRTGATGAAILGSLLSAGADPGSLDSVEEPLDVEFAVRTVDRNGIATTDVTIGAGRTDRNDDARTVDQVLDCLASIDLPEAVAAEAAAVFGILGEATASVSGADPDTVTLSTSGTDEAVATVAGVALLVADLDPDRVVTTPLSAGGGEVRTDDALVPVPTPTILEVAGRADWTIRGGPVDDELLTPVGAALLAHFASGVESLPELRVTATGYGSGDPALEDRPNVLRALVGEERLDEDEDPGTGSIAVLETSVDDVAPEVLGGLQTTLKDAGARDVSVVPLTMKKSRPGHLVKVIARPDDADRVARRLVEETGTLGVRRTNAEHAFFPERSVDPVTVELDDTEYELDVKVATDDAGELLDVSAEYDDALAVATETDRPVREVLRRAESAYWD